MSKSGRPYAKLYADGGGLYLRVDPSGAKSWVFRYAIAGRQRDFGLGSAADYLLAEARDRALTARKLVAAGQDPMEAKEAKRRAAAVAGATAMTFQACAEGYIAAHQAGWKNPKHAAQWPSTLATYVYPIFGALPVTAIDTSLVMKARVPERATVPRLSTNSWRSIPMPVSSTVRVPAAASGLMRIASARPSASSSGLAIAS